MYTVYLCLYFLTCVIFSEHTWDVTGEKSVAIWTNLGQLILLGHLDFINLLRPTSLKS